MPQILFTKYNSLITIYQSRIICLLSCRLPMLAGSQHQMTQACYFVRGKCNYSYSAKNCKINSSAHPPAQGWVKRQKIPPPQGWGLYKRTGNPLQFSGLKTPPPVAGLTDIEATKDVAVFVRMTEMNIESFDCAQDRRGRDSFEF